MTITEFQKTLKSNIDEVRKEYPHFADLYLIMVMMRIRDEYLHPSHTQLPEIPSPDFESESKRLSKDLWELERE